MPKTLIQGTDGNDFMHVAGDGHVPPPGDNEISTLDNVGDLIPPLLGDDVIYAGSGDDVIRMYDTGTSLTAADQIDGGGGFNALEINSVDQNNYSGSNALVFG